MAASGFLCRLHTAFVGLSSSLEAEGSHSPNIPDHNMIVSVWFPLDLDYPYKNER